MAVPCEARPSCVPTVSSHTCGWDEHALCACTTSNAASRQERHPIPGCSCCNAIATATTDHGHESDASPTCDSSRLMLATSFGCGWLKTSTPAPEISDARELNAHHSVVYKWRCIDGATVRTARDLKLYKVACAPSRTDTAGMPCSSCATTAHNRPNAPCSKAVPTAKGNRSSLPPPSLLCVTVRAGRHSASSKSAGCT